MAFFKFRKGGDEPSGAPAQPESIEAMRKRAKHRLIGAAVLVLIGVIGFPILFDKQPRPIAVDIPIEIPDRAKAKPLSIPEPVATPAAQGLVAPAGPAPVALAPAPAAPKVEEKVIAAPAPVAAPAASAAPKTVAKPEPKPAEKAPERPAAAKADDGSHAKALLEGKDVEKKADAHAGRFVIQVGAFADAERAHEARLKVERAGLKTYTQVAETKDGRKTRVRVGPFATKAEADKAAAKVKKLGLPAAMLVL